MIDMIISLLTDYTQMFLNPDRIKYKNDKKSIKCMVKIVIAYSDLLEYLSDFYDIWNKWIKSDFNSTPFYYYIVPKIKEKLSNLMEYYAETSKILKYEDRNLDYDIINFIWGKSTIFDVWESILNASYDVLHYEHEDDNKIMFIPNYSLILTDIKTLSKCSVKEGELFIKLLKKKNMNDFHFSYLCYNYEHMMYSKRFQHGFDYIPILLEENYEFRDNPYVLKLHIPDDIKYIHNFISLIKEAIVASEENMNICKKIIEKYCKEENKDLLNFILNS